MAKKKKQTRKRKAEEIQERSAFWPLTGGVLLCVLALFLLLGGFGTGGPLPVNMFKGVYWALGWVAYLSPMALVYWGFHKFMSEDQQIPLEKFIAMVALLVFGSAWLHVAFV